MMLIREDAIDVEESMEKGKESEDYNLILERLRKDLGIV